MKKPVKSAILVEKTREKWSESKFSMDFTHLERKLEEMELLEWKISHTKKTVALNHLYKRLLLMQDKVDSYVYNYNKHDLFSYLAEKMDEYLEKSMQESINHLVQNTAPVR